MEYFKGKCASLVLLIDLFISLLRGYGEFVKSLETLAHMYVSYFLANNEHCKKLVIENFG